MTELSVQAHANTRLRAEKFKALRLRFKQAGFAITVGATALLFMGEAPSPRNTVATLSSPQTTPRIFIDWRNSSVLSVEASQPFDEADAFNTDCPEAATTTDQNEADFVLHMNHRRGPGSADLYRWEILGGSGRIYQESKANVDLVLRHACQSVLRLWQSKQDIENRNVR